MKGKILILTVIKLTYFVRKKMSQKKKTEKKIACGPELRWVRISSVTLKKIHMNEDGKSPVLF